jgi:Rps23 Pro-64 3,4-dihydroxylase Tpa1-like proline 4-hydroxylase
MKKCLELINYENFIESLKFFSTNKPFDHCLIDNFFKSDVAEQLQNEFMDYSDDRWFYYKNAIEDKKACSNWGNFPPLTYQVFQELLSNKFLQTIEGALGGKLYVDHGLHGGGWHIHASGGNLNPHLDYSIHPKMGLLRKLNIIIYLSKELEDSHGGHLGLWDHDKSKNGPGGLVKEIQPIYNRAVLFDTTQNSWHGMSRPLIQPEGIYRKSIAVYYLIQPPVDADPRERALFAPRLEQQNDENILNLIKLRADSKNFHKAYRISDN